MHRPKGRAPGSLAAAAVASALIGGCATHPLPPEIVALQALRTDPSLSGPQKEAFELLAAAEDLLVRSRGEWNAHAEVRARRDALMGQIKMKTALAILQGERSKARLAGLDVAIADAQREEEQVGQELAAVEEELAMASQLKAATARIADERKALAQQLDLTKKQAATDRQKLLDQVASEKRRAEAIDALRTAELDVKTADTVRASEYARAKYSAATAMLQEAHKEFDGARWDEAIARAAVARTEAAAATEASRPRYELAEQVKLASARDRALEEAASAIEGVTVRFEHRAGLQRMILALPRLFDDAPRTFTPDGARALDAIKDLLAAYPSYPIELAAEPREGPADERPATSLARANAIYWALVARGIDPRRMSVLGAEVTAPTPRPTAGDARTHLRSPPERTEIAILYHALQR